MKTLYGQLTRDAGCWPGFSSLFPFPLHTAVPSQHAPLSLRAAGSNRAVKQFVVPQLPCSELAQVPLMPLNYAFETEPVNSVGRA